MRLISPFILYTALEPIENQLWLTDKFYLNVVDRFYSYLVSAFVTAGNIKFLLLHDKKNIEQPIQHFFVEVYDLYVKALLTPFYTVNDKISSPAFDQKVRALAQEHF